MDLRTVEQKATDRLLLLWIIKQASPLDKYKLQKLPFRTEFDMNTRNKRCFHYEFFQYNYGPFSIEVYDDHDALKELSLISESGITSEINKEGERILSEFDSVFKQNGLLLSEMKEMISGLNRMSGFELVEDTHQMTVTWNSKVCKLREIPKHSTILPQQEDVHLKIDSSTLESLIVMLTPELIRDFRRVRSEGSTSSPYVPLTA
ncbi:MAG: hypothetical protein ABSF63_01605 [Candidatus Bathyarchaeia archaeon]